MAYTLKKKLANKSNYGGKRSTSQIKYIVIHYTGNDGDTDENNGKYFANNIVKASAHYFVDDDSITQSVPDDHIAWSVGGNRYSNYKTTGGAKFYGKVTNANTLNIELCDDIKNGVVYPSAKTIANAIEFVKKKMKEYNIPAANVIRHFDVNGKGCPAYWSGNATKNKKWLTEFHNKLSVGSSGGSGSTGTSKPSAGKLEAYSGYITVIYGGSDGLSYHKTPDFNASSVAGTVKKGTVLTVTGRILVNGTYMYKTKAGWYITSSSKYVAYSKGLKGTGGTSASPYYKKYTGTSTQVDKVFKLIGVPDKFRGSWGKRKPVATKNGISNYKGTSMQNTKLVNLARQGKLKKA